MDGGRGDEGTRGGGFRPDRTNCVDCSDNERMACVECRCRAQRSTAATDGALTEHNRMRRTPAQADAHKPGPAGTREWARTGWRTSVRPHLNFLVPAPHTVRTHSCPRARAQTHTWLFGVQGGCGTHWQPRRSTGPSGRAAGRRRAGMPSAPRRAQCGLVYTRGSILRARTHTCHTHTRRTRRAMACRQAPKANKQADLRRALWHKTQATFRSGTNERRRPR